LIGPVFGATLGLGHEVVTPDRRTATENVKSIPNLALILSAAGVSGSIPKFLIPGILLPTT
jgi:hypothetical protein